MVEETEEIKKYKNALWDFMLEHSRILRSGTMRIIFDTPNRRNFEKRVNARLLYNYHREDTVVKQDLINSIQTDWTTKKQARREKYKNDKKNRREMLEEINKAIKKVEEFNALPKWKRFFIRFLNIYD